MITALASGQIQTEPVPNQGVLWRMGRSMITGEVHLPRPALLYLFVTLLLHCQQSSNSLRGPSLAIYIC